MLLVEWKQLEHDVQRNGLIITQSHLAGILKSFLVFEPTLSCSMENQDYKDFKQLIAY
jgi:hypothetical protein